MKKLFAFLFLMFAFAPAFAVQVSIAAPNGILLSHYRNAPVTIEGNAASVIKLSLGDHIEPIAGTVTEWYSITNDLAGISTPLVLMIARSDVLFHNVAGGNDNAAVILMKGETAVVINDVAAKKRANYYIIVPLGASDAKTISWEYEIPRNANRAQMDAARTLVLPQMQPGSMVNVCKATKENYQPGDENFPDWRGIIFPPQGMAFTFGNVTFTEADYQARYLPGDRSADVYEDGCKTFLYSKLRPGFIYAPQYVYPRQEGLAPQN